MLRIGELATKTGLTAHTIRFYEKSGLINASQRSESGYRYYTDTDTDVRQAEFVKTARKIGFPSMMSRHCFPYELISLIILVRTSQK